MSSINISSISNNNYSILLDSLNGKSSSSSPIDGGLLSEWANIRNGSYGKLAKQYYAKNASSSSASEDEDNISNSLVKANTVLKNDASELRDSISDISDSKTLLTSKVTTKDADGNETTDYDWNKITKSLEAFAKEYNSVLDGAVESSNTSVLRYASQMTTTTSRNESKLESIGISVGSDNKLTVDADKVKKANIDDIKSLFQGQSSYASSIDSNAYNIEIAVNAENNKLSNYNSTGSYTNVNSSGSIYDAIY